MPFGHATRPLFVLHRLLDNEGQAQRAVVETGFCHQAHWFQALAPTLPRKVHWASPSIPLLMNHLLSDCYVLDIANWVPELQLYITTQFLSSWESSLKE